PLRGEGGDCCTGAAKLHPTARVTIRFDEGDPDEWSEGRVSKDAFGAAAFSAAMVRDAGLRPAPHHEGWGRAHPSPSAQDRAPHHEGGDWMGRTTSRAANLHAA